MKIATVITAFNEGIEVDETVTSMAQSMCEADTELLIIVVDDGSTDGSCDSATLNPPCAFAEALADRCILHVVRHETPQGVGCARNAGLALALDWGADVVSFHDGHMRFPLGHIEAMARKALESDAIITSKAKGWWYGADHPKVKAGTKKAGEGHGFVAWGADMHWNASHGLQPKYRVYPKKERGGQPEWTRVPCPMGACYLFSRQTIERLMAPTDHLWDDIVGRWGFSEQALAVKAFLLDIPVLVSRDIQTHHHYKSANPVPDAAKEIWRNVCYSMALLLSAETYDLRFRRYAEGRLGFEAAARLQTKAATDRAALGPLPWTADDELRIFTDLCGRDAPITTNHPDHAWLAELGAICAAMPVPPQNVLQWRPGESTLLLKRLYPTASIKTIEWSQHRASNWSASASLVSGIHFMRCELADWGRLLTTGHLKADQSYDLITLGGEFPDECRATAEKVLAPGGKIVVNLTADRLQIADEYRKKDGEAIELLKSGGTQPQSAAAAPSHRLVDVQRRVVAMQAGTSITVLLLNYQRAENIGPILDCLRAQTAKPQIMLWNNGLPVNVKLAGGAPVPLAEDERIDLYVRPSENMLCFPRWWLGSLATTDYVCSLDDDLILTDPRVLDDAMAAQRELCPSGIVGPSGVVRKEGKPYKDWKHYNGHCEQDVAADVIKGRFMCFRTALLAMVPLRIPGVGHREDDIILSLCIGDGRPTPHMIPARLCNRVQALGKQDRRSMAMQPGHYTKRDAAFREVAAFVAAR